MKRFYITHTLIFLWIALVHISCSKDDTTDIYPVNEDVVLKDVSYGSHERHKMDIYLPAGRSTSETKIVVFIHGGGWIGGDKDDLPLDTEDLELMRTMFPGVALFNLNYRLVVGTENQFPAAADDIRNAVDHIYSNLQAYQVSSDTYMAGGSAGAHLAALYALKHNTQNRVKGCVAISGAFDLVSLYHEGSIEAKQVLTAFLGGSPTEHPERYHEASPINFVTSSSPKFLILHGREDELTPIGQANDFIQELQDKGVEQSSFLYSGGHSIPPEHMLEAILRIKAFWNSFWL